MMMWYVHCPIKYKQRYIFVYTRITGRLMLMVRLLYFLGIVWSSGVACAQVDQQLAIRLAGVYRGEALYVQNPYSAVSRRFIVDRMTINDRPLKMNYNVSALVIDFKGLERYVPVSVRIFYQDSVHTPKILNPEAIRYHNNFRFLNVDVNDSVLNWSSKGEQPDGKYLVQRYELDYWDVIDTLAARGIFGGSSYASFPLFIEGVNKFRIRYEEDDGTYQYSPEVEMAYYAEKVRVTRAGDELILSRAASFEVVDGANEMVLQGQSNRINISSLPKGEYVIIFDEKFLKSFRK